MKSTHPVHLKTPSSSSGVFMEEWYLSSAFVSSDTPVGGEGLAQSLRCNLARRSFSWSQDFLQTSQVVPHQIFLFITL